MRQKMKCQRSKAFCLKRKINLITNSIANQQEKVANMTDGILGKISKKQR